MATFGLFRFLILELDDEDLPLSERYAMPSTIW